MEKFGDIIDSTGKFIEKQKGYWDHINWERFLKDVQKIGGELTEETKSYLGEVLESAKKFYHSLSTEVKEAKKERAITEVPKKEEKLIKRKLEKELKVQPLKKTRLTKGFFTGLEEGLFLVSNVLDEDGKTIFAEKVSSLSNRENQWKKIVAASANHRSCSIFKNKKEYESYLAQRLKEEESKE